MQPLSEKLSSWLGEPTAQVGTLASVTPWLVLKVVLFFVVVYLTGWFVRRRLVLSVMRRSDADIGVKYAVARIAGYLVWAVALLIGLPMLGVELSSLAIAFGTLGIGIGLGLQKIAQDFVSGLILLFERPVAVGDRVDVGGTVGTVVDVRSRVSEIRTNDNVSILVPNSEFISGRVINLSHSDKVTRFRFPVGVSYGSDPELVRKCLLEVAVEHSAILEDPEPDVLFMEYGDSSLNFVLRAYTREMLYYPDKIRSEVNFAIHRKFKATGVEIPFPQRDLHIKSVTEDAAERLGTAKRSRVQAPPGP